MGWTIKPQGNGVKAEGHQGTTSYTFDIAYSGKVPQHVGGPNVKLEIRHLTTDAGDGVRFADKAVSGNAYEFPPLVVEGQENSRSEVTVVPSLKSSYASETVVFSITVEVQGDRQPEFHELFAVSIKSVHWDTQTKRDDEGIYEFPNQSAYGAVWNDDAGGEDPRKPVSIWHGFEKFSEDDQNGVLDQFGRVGEDPLDQADDRDDPTGELGAPKSLAPTGPAVDDSFHFAGAHHDENPELWPVIAPPSDPEKAPDTYAAEDHYDFAETSETDPWSEA